MKKTILILALFILLSSFVSAEIFMQQNTQNGQCIIDANADRCAQTFAVQSSFNITIIRAHLDTTGAPINLECSIWENDADNKPSIVVANATNSLAQQGGGFYGNFTFTGTDTLTAGTNYSFVFSSGGGLSGALRWKPYHNTSAGFALGHEAVSADNGTTWTINSASDLEFQITGVNITVPDVTPPTITINYPTTSGHYNPSPNFINVTLNEDGNCTLNNTYWPYFGGSSTIASFYNASSQSDGIYVINITCNDTTGNVNSTLLNFTVDSSIPVITWLIPSATTTYTNSQLYTINANVTDTYLDIINLTIYNSTNNIVFTNQTTITSGTTFNQTDKLNLSSYSGEGSYTLQICARDSATDSPQQPNYHATPLSNQVFYYDENSDLDLTMTFQLLNPQDHPTSLEDYELNIQTENDGKHIKTSFSMLRPPNGFKIKHTYHSNNENDIRPISSDLIGHFVIADKFFQHQDYVNDGYTVYTYMEDGDFIVILYKQDYGVADYIYADPISGGLNTVCSNKTLIYDATAPSQVSLEYPSNATTTSSDDISFQFNVTDETSIANCSVYINGTINSTDTSITMNTTQTINVNNMQDAIYSWMVQCYDNAGNSKNSSTYTLTIDAVTTTTTTTSGGGGGGGGSSSVICPENSYQDGGTCICNEGYYTANLNGFFECLPTDETIAQELANIQPSKSNFWLWLKSLFTPKKLTITGEQEDLAQTIHQTEQQEGGTKKMVTWLLWVLIFIGAGIALGLKMLLKIPYLSKAVEFIAGIVVIAYALTLANIMTIQQVIISLPLTTYIMPIIGGFLAVDGIMSLLGFK